MADKNTIKNWYKTGLMPTQAQFSATWDSFWHKEEKIPITAIEDIENILNAKAETEVLTDHLTTPTAHADLFNTKEDKTNKGAANGYVPLNSFIKISSQYLAIVDDLLTGGSTSLLSAEQGKVLKIQIDAINTLLTSNDVNLDTVQEIVNAIKIVETSLSTILVNDLTTGGTTKALTAEMGKQLNENAIHKTGDETKTGTLIMMSDKGAGCVGISKLGLGIFGQSTSNVGIYGLSEIEAGVKGLSNYSDGVQGYSGNGTGMHCSSFSGIGLKVLNDTSNISNLAEFGKMGTDEDGKLSTIDYQGNMHAPKFVTKNGKANQYVRGDGELSYFDAAISRNIIKDVEPSLVTTGTASEVLLKTYLIPANTFNANDVMYIKDFSIVCTGAAPVASDLVEIIVRIGTANSFASSVICSVFSTINSNVALKRIKYSGSTNINDGLITYSTGLSTGSDNGRTYLSSLPFNPAVDNYVFTSIKNTSIGVLNRQLTFVITN
jgi:hypothetical protein